MDFKPDDWFRFMPGCAPSEDMEGESFRVNSVASQGRFVSFLAPGHTEWYTADVRDIVEVPDPNPGLTALANLPRGFNKPEAVKQLLEDADAIIRPEYSRAGDWEFLHMEEDTLFAKSFRVMQEHPDHRDEILRKMLEVVAQQIPRW